MSQRQQLPTAWSIPSMPTLKAFASTKYRAISVPRPHQFDLREISTVTILLRSPDCINTRHEFRHLFGIERDSVDNQAG
jgi:hypothetical protein